MKTMKDTFEENYEAVPRPGKNKRGFKIRYQYVGLWYRWNISQKEMRSCKLFLAGTCVLSILFFLMASLPYSYLNHSRFVELPGTLSIAALLFEVIGVVQFCAAGEKVTNMSFQGIHIKLNLAPAVHAVLLLGTGAACISEMLRMPVSIRENGIAACYFLSGAASFLLFLRYHGLPYGKEKNV
ncbi:MAG: hypothetical protein PHE06_01100 [Lachnospiraceae bacterium]|nr:hypothetical protein [Lachnospiraceae bacterium]